MSLATGISALATRIGQYLAAEKAKTFRYRVSLGQVQAGASVTHTITFPKPFASVPVIVATAGATSTGASAKVTLRSWDATGCRVVVENDSTAASVMWLMLVASLD